jgi:hypothetical protein
MLFRRSYQRKIWITILLFIVIACSVFPTVLFDQYELNKNNGMLLHQIHPITTKRLEKLHCQSRPLHPDLKEPKLLLNMKYFLRYFNEYHKMSGWTTFETFYVVWFFC